MDISLNSIETRKHLFDETIKTLERKDFKSLASLGIPSIDDAEEMHLEFSELPMTDMREADYIAKVIMHEEEFILHMEFETNYSSNKKMNKRMLRYYTYISWYEDLPIYQVLIILKKPDINIISTGIKSIVQNEEILNYNYKIIRAYEMDKYEVLKQKKIVIYPLRVFMKHEKESDLEHIAECLSVVEALEDKDYYYLTVELSKRLYKEEILEKYVKEDVYMSSALFKNPYEKGIEDEKERSRLKDVRSVEKLLTKKFGILDKEVREKIENADSYNLNLIIENILDLERLEDALRYLG